MDIQKFAKLRTTLQCLHVNTPVFLAQSVTNTLSYSTHNNGDPYALIPIVPFGADTAEAAILIPGI